MFLGAYHFDGETDALRAAYDRLMTFIPVGIVDLNVCVVRAGGITVYDACPSQEVFEGFSTSPDFATALASAGLPAPRVEQLGDIHNVVVRPPEK
jgi:hypothetical protein